MKIPNNIVALLSLLSSPLLNCSRQPLSMPIPSHMKCIVYGRDRPILKIVPTPKPKKDHILVRVKAVGLNPVDAKEVIGDKLPHHWKISRSFIRSYVIASKIPGFDFSGTCVVDDSHDLCTGSQIFSNGDKVFGTMPPLQGSLAEYISVPLDQICAMPRNFTFLEAAALPLVG